MVRAAYNPKQVARILFGFVTENPTIYRREIENIVIFRGMYTFRPDSYHLRDFSAELLNHMAQDRELDMAALDGYFELLKQQGHHAEVFEISGGDMKQTSIRDAEHIFKQMKKEGFFRDDENLDMAVVDLSDILDEGLNYGGLVSVPNIAPIFFLRERPNEDDHRRCPLPGSGPSKLRYSFSSCEYDENSHIKPLVFAHLVGTESEDTWGLYLMR